VSAELNNATPSNVIVYDDECMFCMRQMAWIRRRDRMRSFDFIGRHDPALLARFPALTGDDLSTGLRFVDDSGRIARGADAAYEIARRLPFWRRWVWLYRVPGLHRLYQVLYAWIARNRMRLGGSCESGACKVRT
jgi:predicted DCC family thiol-disulfide oxidoreductase YuxK